MKKRKREKLNQQKEAKKKDWQETQYLQHMEKAGNLIFCHFEPKSLHIIYDNGKPGFDVQKTIPNLSCEDCCHFEMECKGRQYRGESVIECLMKPEHKYCDINEYDGIDEYEEDEEDDI
jgi:hypothetical protein